LISLLSVGREKETLVSITYRFLEFTDLTEGNSARPESVGLLDSAGGRGASGFAGGSLVSNVLSGDFGSSVLAGGLLCSCHVVSFCRGFYY
jgi:hypothetical protein